MPMPFRPPRRSEKPPRPRVGVIPRDPVVAVPLAVALWLGAVAVAAVAARLWVTAASAPDQESPELPAALAVQIYRLGRRAGERGAAEELTTPLPLPRPSGRGSFRR